MNKYYAVLLFAALAACDQLPLKGPNGFSENPADKIKPPNPPKVSVAAVTLVKAPTNEDLAKYYCPAVANGWVCRAFGQRPPAEALRFSFSIDLLIENPNTVPLPAVEALVALKAFPQTQAASNFGAACVALCEEGQDCGPPAADACTESGKGVLKTKSDYLGAAAKFLVATARGQVKPQDLRVRMIPAGAQTTIRTQFDIDVDAMLALIANLADQAVEQIKSGKVPTFVVPYEVEGAVWLSVENFGKVGANFGPKGGTWNLQ